MNAPADRCREIARYAVACVLMIVADPSKHSSARAPVSHHACTESTTAKDTENSESPINIPINRSLTRSREECMNLRRGPTTCTKHQVHRAIHGAICRFGGRPQARMTVLRFCRCNVVNLCLKRSAWGMSALTFQFLKTCLAQRVIKSTAQDAGIVACSCTWWCGVCASTALIDDRYCADADNKDFSGFFVVWIRRSCDVTLEASASMTPQHADVRIWSLLTLRLHFVHQDPKPMRFQRSHWVRGVQSHRHMRCRDH